LRGIFIFFTLFHEYAVVKMALLYKQTGNVYII